MRNRILLLALPLLVASCANTQVSKLGPSLPARPADCEIQILTESPTGRKYQEVGIINISSGQSVFSSKTLDGMLPKMKAKACEVGADAIILKNVQTGAFPWLQTTRGSAFGVAIKFEAAPPPQ